MTGIPTPYVFYDITANGGKDRPWDAKCKYVK